MTDPWVEEMRAKMRKRIEDKGGGEYACTRIAATNGSIICFCKERFDVIDPDCMYAEPKK